MKVLTQSIRKTWYSYVYRWYESYDFRNTFGYSFILWRYQQTNGGQITAKRDDQTKTYTNQAFETEEDQLADEVSSQFRLLDGLQDGGERNQNVD